MSDNLQELLVSLEQHICRQGTIIEELQKDNINLRNRIDFMEKKIELTEEKKLLRKYMVAIRDINNCRNFVRRTDNFVIRTSFQQLDTDSVDFKENYIYGNDYCGVTLVESKIIILQGMMQRMPNNITNIFNNKYPKVIETIVSHAETYPSNMDPLNLNSVFCKNVHEWWEK